MKDNLRWKTTFNGRRPSMKDDLQWKTTIDGRGPSMEDDLRWKTTFNGRRPLCSSSIFPARAIDHSVLLCVNLHEIKKIHHYQSSCPQTEPC